MRRLAGLAGRSLMATILVAVAGCGGDVCEHAAEICADQQEVAAPEDRDEGSGAECEGTLADHAACIVEADSCAPDVVARCWADATAGAEEGDGG